MRDPQEIVEKKSYKLKVWWRMSLIEATITLIISVLIFYLLSRLDGLDIIHLFMGIFQSSTLLLNSLVLTYALAVKTKTQIMGSVIVMLIISIGCLLFYFLTVMASMFKLYQGKMALMPAHPLQWYTIENIYSISLLIQNFIAIFCCLTSYKTRNLISDLVKDEVLEVDQFDLNQESIAQAMHYLMLNENEDVKSKFRKKQAIEEEITKSAGSIDSKGVKKETKDPNQNKDFRDSVVVEHQASSYTMKRTNLMNAVDDSEGFGTPGDLSSLPSSTAGK